MIIDGLDCRACEEPHALASAHASHLERNAGTENVEKETLEGMVVQGTEGVRNIKAVMTGVEGG